MTELTVQTPACTLLKLALVGNDGSPLKCSCTFVLAPKGEHVYGGFVYVKLNQCYELNQQRVYAWWIMRIGLHGSETYLIHFDT